MAGRAFPVSEQPDFALIYAFLGSLFDPNCGGIDHMDVLEEMKDIDRQTATLLMRNVINNLQSPEVGLLALLAKHPLLVGATFSIALLKLESAPGSVSDTRRLECSSESFCGAVPFVEGIVVSCFATQDNAYSITCI